MAVLVWTRSIRAVRDTPVEDYSAPGINTTGRVPYHPPIAVSQFLLALSVSYFKQTLRRCGQLWPDVGMGSLCTHLHRDCDAMGDAAKISPCDPSTSMSRRVGRRWEDMILPGHENPRNCMDPNLGKSEWDQRLGNVDCVFLLYDKMIWKWDAVYLPRGFPDIYSASLFPPLLPLYLHTRIVAHSSSVTPVSPYTYRCSFHLRYLCISGHPPSLVNNRLGGSDRASFGDALWGRDQVDWEIHLEAVVDRIWRCAGRPRWSELRDALGGHDWSSLEIHWEAVIERVWTWACRPRLSELRDALRGCDRASLEMHVQAMIERDWRSTWRRSIWREARRQLSLYSLVNLKLWEYRELSTTSAERWETSWERHTVDLGMMLNLVYAGLGVNGRVWHGEIERDDLTSCS